MNRRILFTTFAIACAGLATLGASAQTADWPTKPVKVVVPFSPGGSADTLGRLISQHLQSVFKQPFIIENKGGAGGIIGSTQVAKAAPDGYTLVISGIASHVIAPVETKSFDPIADFTHIALLGGPPLVLVVHPSMGVSNVKELVAKVKSDKDGLSWGSPGNGTHANLIGELFAKATGIKQTHIGYKGSAPALADLVGGQIPAAFMTLTTANSQIKAGNVKALAITSEHRLADFPGVPTFAELGYPQLNAFTWFSLSGPAGMPASLVEKINAEVRRGLKTQAMQKQLALENIETRDWDVATFNGFVKSEIERWQPIVRSLEKK
ncbi:MAG: tripartite tricarboxylate transporter substrate binding protein [Variovorax sp.]